ncbi:TPA: porin family protein [Legionella pneumophila]|nr:porin family protein [Legionella pneumophila]HAT8868490.1 porin family protein [Legionella pneumophila subsp. pneumophila]HAT8890654.1 porin family protein [Legionella pneumophila subsp. pneumophila]HAT8933597.1 porin family protein [Legionella pneumophila subsp. pneumophila]HAU0162489.1 porin family protein [Legionella pneumophila]
MKHYFFISMAIASLLAGNTLAGTMGPPAKDWAWVGSISAGPVWVRGGEIQTFFLAPEIEKTYVPRKSTNTLANGELFIGIHKILSPQWLAQFGLAVATTDNTKLQGVIWDDTDPRFDNHSYQYKIRHSRITAKAKLLLDKKYWFIPWLSGSLGIGFNRAYDFSNTPLIFEALPNPNFNNHTQTAFAYALGAGAQKAFSEHWQVGIGYELVDWGKSELDRAEGQTMNSGLKLNHLYTHGVLLNFTYVV